MTTGRFAKWGCGSGNGSPQEVRDTQVIGRFVPLLFEASFGLTLRMVAPYRLRPMPNGVLIWLADA